MSIQDIFGELERDAGISQESRVFRRLLPDSDFDLRLEVVKSTNRHRFSVGCQPNQNDKVFAEMRGLLVISELETGRLVVELIEPRLDQLFNALIADLLGVFSVSSNTANSIRITIDRLNLWRRLFSDSLAEGLTPELQRGLFCELLCLRDVFLPVMQASLAIDSWLAPYNSTQDFQTDAVAIEVKSRFRRGNTTVRISSEDQLEPGAKRLFLLVFSLDTGGNASLNDMADSILESLSDSPIAQMSFSDSLKLYGYLDVHREKYEQPKYSSTLTCFAVEVGFPKILASDLEQGITNVNYDLDLSACVPFTVSLDSIISLLGGTGG